MNIEQARTNMIEQQIRTWEVLDRKVLDVIGAVPRERFVPEQYRTLAFADTEIPLSYGERMMTPKVEARMLQALDIRPEDAALEIGTGSGFVTACLARLAGHVTSIDIHGEFTASAEDKLRALSVDNVELYTGDAADGCSGSYDVIAVTGSLPVYKPCFEQSLNPGGRLFVVIGQAPAMTATLVTRAGEQDDAIDRDNPGGFHRIGLFETSLRPLINAVKPVEFAF